MNGYKKPRDKVSPENRQWAVARLQAKAAELGCPPTKADFEECDRMKIKTFLGPWPRALEAAGLKEPKVK